MEGFENSDPTGSRLLLSVFQCSRMNSYSNEELAYMLIVYGVVNCKGNTARGWHRERYPNSGVLHHTTFASVNRKLRKTGSSTRATINRQRMIKTPSNEKAILPEWYKTIQSRVIKR
ncbi:hypothetical protein TNCV_94121 [Trichonephila clavipes]|nr:hypothetical protein TNCV_94121 [Trichonephila clavipes]